MCLGAALCEHAFPGVWAGRPPPHTHTAATGAARHRSREQLRLHDNIAQRQSMTCQRASSYRLEGCDSSMRMGGCKLLMVSPLCVCVHHAHLWQLLELTLLMCLVSSHGLRPGMWWPQRGCWATTFRSTCAVDAAAVPQCFGAARDK